MVTKTVTIDGNVYRVYPDGRQTPVATYYWNSTDERPIVGVEDADIGLEKDTKKVFLFDFDSKDWMEQ